MKGNNKLLLVVILLITTMVVIPLSYAKYTETHTKHITLNIRKPEYTVVFNSNNGSSTTTSQHFVYGTSQNLNVNTFSMAHNDFNGWNTKTDGTGDGYSDEENVNNLTQRDGATFNLYAMWIANEYAITYTGLSDTTGLPTYAAARVPLTITNVNVQNRTIDSIKIGNNELNSSNYTFNNGTITINVPITAEVNIIFGFPDIYTFRFDGTTDDGTTITVTPPNLPATSTIDDIIAMDVSGINISEKTITKIEVSYTYTTTKGSSQIIDVILSTSTGISSTKSLTIQGKQNNSIVTATFDNLSLNYGDTFNITNAENDVNNRSVDFSDVSIKVTLSE